MKTSNKLLLGLLILILLTIATVMVVVKTQFGKLGGPIHKNSGKLATEQRDLTKFNLLEVENAIKVNYTQDTFQRVVINADSSLINLVVSEVRSGKLYLYMKESVKLHDPIQVDITTDSINEVKLSAGGIFSTTQKMHVSKLNGNGTAGAIFEVEGDFDELNLDMTAGCVANLRGTCNFMDVSCTAGGILNSNDMIAKTADVSANAGGIMNVNVTDEISVDVNAGGIIKCSGKAHVKKINVSSGGQFVN